MTQDDVSGNEPRKRRSFLATLLRPKFAIPAILAGALIGVPFGYRLSRVAGIPDSGAPFDLEKWGTVAIPSGDNAFDGYRTAALLATDIPADEDAAFGVVQEKGWSEATAGLKSWLDTCRPAIPVWLEATAKPELLAIQPKDLHLDTFMTLDVSSIRRMVRVAQAEGLRLESEGQLEEAWNLHRALFRCSRHASRHGCLIDRLISTSLHSNASTAIERWSRQSALTSEQLDAALMTLRNDDSLTAPLSATLRSEYFFLSNMLERSDLAQLFEDHGATGVANSMRMQKVRLFLRNEPLVGRLLSKQIYANLLDHVDKPFKDRPALVSSGGISVYVDPPGEPASPQRLSSTTLLQIAGRSTVVTMFFPAISSALQAFDRERSRQVTLETVLAIQSFHRRTRRYPESLQQLVDAKIVDRIPLDPDSPLGEPLRYLKDDESIVVWGVGQNGVDDGGDVVTIPGRGQSLDVGFKIPISQQ